VPLRGCSQSHHPRSSVLPLESANSGRAVGEMSTNLSRNGITHQSWRAEALAGRSNFATVRWGWHRGTYQTFAGLRRCRRIWLEKSPFFRSEPIPVEVPMDHSCLNSVVRENRLSAAAPRTHFGTPRVEPPSYCTILLEPFGATVHPRASCMTMIVARPSWLGWRVWFEQIRVLGCKLAKVSKVRGIEMKSSDAE